MGTTQNNSACFQNADTRVERRCMERKRELGQTRLVYEHDDSSLSRCDFLVPATSCSSK
jgi:hypothetical protein